MTLVQAAIAVLQEGQEIKGAPGFVAVPRNAMVALTQAVLSHSDENPALALAIIEDPSAEECLAARFALLAEGVGGSRA